MAASLLHFFRNSAMLRETAGRGRRGGKAPSIKRGEDRRRRSGGRSSFKLPQTSLRSASPLLVEGAFAGGAEPRPYEKSKRQQHIVQQVHSARDFVPRRGLEYAGILCVFQVFQTDELGQKIRRRPKMNDALLPNTKRPGRRTAPASRRESATIRGTDGLDRGNGRG